MTLKRGLGRTAKLLAMAGVVVGVLGGSIPAQAVTGDGFSFAPAFTDVAVPAGQPRVQFAVSLRNQSGQAQAFRLSVADFGSLDEQGGVAFLGAPASELEHQYGLSSWMSADQQTVTVPARGQVKITLTIDNRDSLAPGGHYGAVLATAIDNVAASKSEPQVGVKQVLSSLVLATKEGGLAPSLEVVSQTTDGGWGHLPSKVTQRFHNTGNIHVVPRGVTEVKDPAGRVVVRGALNESSGAVLPDSFRRFTTPLLDIAPAWVPGQYRVVTTYRYDGTDDTKTFTTTFWYAGAIVLLSLGLLLLAFVGLGVWWFWWWRRRRNRHKNQP